MARVGKIYWLVILLFVAFSCNKDSFDDASEYDDDVVDKTQSVLVYMASNNNLYSYSLKNIDSLVRNYNEDHYRTGNMVVYQRGIGDSPKLMVIDNDTSATVVKTYDEHNAADTLVLRQVIDDFKTLFPADNYGCILWSHGTAWLPQTFTNYATKSSSQSSYSLGDKGESIENHPYYDQIRQQSWSYSTKAFAEEDDTWIEIDELARALEDSEFNFIMFDACYMMSIEVAYELRNKASWMLGAPTEVISNGFDYSTMAYNFFLDIPINERLIKVADDMVDKYSEATVSLVNLDKMSSFAQKYSAILDSIPDILSAASPYSVQRYDRFSDHVLFDMSDYIYTIAPDYGAEMDSLLDDIVEYKRATDTFLYISLAKYCGVSSYIPFENYTSVTPFYKELSWWKNVMQKD